MKKVHTFKASKEVGDKGEKELDNYFSDKFTIENVSMELQKLGWDRVFIHPSGARASVEYKTDTRASSTGNIFIETWSNKEVKRGWAYTSTAQWLYYYLPDTKVCYIIDMVKLKLKLPSWELTFKKKGAFNPSYSSEGICVPIEIFKEACYEEIIICRGE